jgi:hypothetical protein
MSVIVAAIGLTLVLVPSVDSTTRGVGISLILTVTSAWFIPSAAKQVVQQVAEQLPVDERSTTKLPGE